MQPLATVRFFRSRSPRLSSKKFPDDSGGIGVLFLFSVVLFLFVRPDMLGMVLFLAPAMMHFPFFLTWIRAGADTLPEGK